MKITAQEEYGLRCMLLLAGAGQGNPMTIPEIGKHEGLSIPYVGKILMILKQAGLIEAVRGRNGGYVLTAAPEEMYLSRIFNALGEPLYSPSHCRRHTGGQGNCVHYDDCQVRPIWLSFGKFIKHVFDRVSLADLLSGDFELPEIPTQLVGKVK